MRFCNTRVILSSYPLMLVYLQNDLLHLLLNFATCKNVVTHICRLKKLLENTNTHTCIHTYTCTGQPEQLPVGQLRKLN